MNRSTNQTPDTLDLSDVHAADLFDRTAELLLGLSPLECTVHPSPGDDEGLLLMAATLLCRQFHLVMGLCVSGDDRRAALMATSDRANGFRAASPAALGAMSSLLDGVACNDLEAAAGTLDSALDVLEVADLFDAAASLMAALTVVIADRLALDPLRVHRETRDAATSATTGRSEMSGMTGEEPDVATADQRSDGVASSSVARRAANADPDRKADIVIADIDADIDADVDADADANTMAADADRHGGRGQSPTGKADRFRGRARRRQTCSGRNSQCHGSRGTASTHPKRGPFVLSH